jgi:addiction module RelE/StbE family toxin
MEIKFTTRFKKRYKKLPPKIKKEAEKKERIFRLDPFDPRLKTHSLSGKEKECWAFWISYSYRIKFVFLSEKKILFLDIGTHKIYK